jgi:hypothetical protein
METIYLVFAAAGTTVLIIQFLLTLIGLDLGHDVDAGHVEIGVGDAEAGGDVVDVSGDHNLDSHIDGHGHAHEAGSSFFRMLSIRAVTAACAFFGLGGLAADSMELSALISLPVALVAGFIAMYIVAWIMRVLFAPKAMSISNAPWAAAVPCTWRSRVKIRVSEKYWSTFRIARWNTTREAPTDPWRRVRP